jgi:hypothetical protein
MRFSQKSWKTIKVFKNHEIFTLPRNHENMSKYFKNREIFPEIMKNCQSVWKSWDFHIAQKSWKTIKKIKIMRFSHCPEKKIMKNRQSVLKSWFFPRNHEKLSKVFKNHEIFTLPRNHENMSKYLKIVRFSQKSWKTVKSLKIMRFSHCPEIIKNCQNV